MQWAFRRTSQTVVMNFVLLETVEFLSRPKKKLQKYGTEGKVNKMKNIKVTKCKGEGQGSCKRCNDYGIWNRQWMCFLYEIEGYEGCYCSYCVEEIMERDENE